MASAEARERSRSPARTAAPGPAAAAGAEAGVPSHWLKKADESGAATPSTNSGKGGGKSGGKAGKRAALLAGTVKEEPKADEVVTASMLLSLAARVESGGEDPKPADVAATLRRAAARLGSLERVVGELGQTLRTVSSLAGKTLAGTGCLSGDAADVGNGAAEDDHCGKSYLLKKGDEDIQEAHRAALARPAMVTGGGTTGGTGAAAVPATSREEMDAARKARLERLEAQQAGKVKEQEEAAAKNRSREALFEKIGAGAAKPLGKL